MLFTYSAGLISVQNCDRTFRYAKICNLNATCDLICLLFPFILTGSFHSLICMVPPSHSHHIDTNLLFRLLIFYSILLLPTGPDFYVSRNTSNEHATDAHSRYNSSSRHQFKLLKLLFSQQTGDSFILFLDLLLVNRAITYSNTRELMHNIFRVD